MTLEIRLDGKVALVTGGNTGIGAGCVRKLAESGADVAINYRSDRSRESAEDLAEEVRGMGRRALPIQADLTDRDAIGTMFAAVDTGFSRLDILVNNAGIGGEGTGVDQPLDEWDKVLAVNLTAPFICTKYAVDLMRRGGRGGRILNITSVHEEAPGGGSVAYPVSKAGLRNLTRASALQLAPEGIFVTAVAPGMILTKMNQEASNDPEVLANAERQIPARRAGQPEDIGHMVAFLASDLGSYVTGSSIFVDGGWMLDWPAV
ncbi:MAG TPA: SDR family oxidoreductase [Thermomicrobiales bacterium]|jgi:glucose 1-dehydrogenase|nr:SDR family oxidoreductase [Thermomicrobiales bacterium]